MSADLTVRFGNATLNVLLGEQAGYAEHQADLAAASAEAAAAVEAEMVQYSETVAGHGTVADSGTSWTTQWMIPDEPAPTDGLWSTASFVAVAAGPVSFGVFSKSGSTFTLVRSRTIQASSGVNSAAEVLLDIAAGEYVGLYGLTKYVTGAGGVWYAGSPGTFTLNPSIEVQFNAVLQGIVRGNATKGADIFTKASGAFDEQLVGEATIATTGATWAGAVGIDVVDPTPSDIDGYVTQIEIAAESAGTVTIGIYSRSGSTMSLLHAQSASIASGANTVPLALPIAVGQYVGFIASVAPSYVNPGARAYYYPDPTPPITSGTAVILSAPINVKFNATIKGTSLAFKDIIGELASTSTALAAKKWAAIGDSNTINGSYTLPLAAATGMVLTNCGVSGTTVASGVSGSGGDFEDQIPSVPADSELVTCYCGTNDMGLGGALGALGDTTWATFYGGLYRLINDIHTQAAAARIVFIVCHAGANTGSGVGHLVTDTNGAGKMLRQYQRAVQEVADWWGIPCIGLGFDGSFNGLLDGSLYSDGLHFNSLGGIKAATFIAGELTRQAESGLFL